MGLDPQLLQQRLSGLQFKRLTQKGEPEVYVAAPSLDDYSEGSFLQGFVGGTIVPQANLAGTGTRTGRMNLAPGGVGVEGLPLPHVPMEQVPARISALAYQRVAHIEDRAEKMQQYYSIIQEMMGQEAPSHPPAPPASFVEEDSLPDYEVTEVHEEWSPEPAPQPVPSGFVPAARRPASQVKTAAAPPGIQQSPRAPRGRPVAPQARPAAPAAKSPSEVLSLDFLKIPALASLPSRAEQRVTFNLGPLGQVDTKVHWVLLEEQFLVLVRDLRTGEDVFTPVVNSMPLELRLYSAEGPMAYDVISAGLKFEFGVFQIMIFPFAVQDEPANIDYQGSYHG